MGVKGLWPLLEPVGRRISIEALRNKRLAVDASIWLFQFIQAMRDERGELIRNAHVLGFFRRICRLLFHRIRPVFVFDGATPALKKQTTAARRRRREQEHAKLRRTAEALLMNQLKQHALGRVSDEQLREAVRAGGSAGDGAEEEQERQPQEEPQEEQQQHEDAARARKGKAPLQPDEAGEGGAAAEHPPSRVPVGHDGAGSSAAAVAAAQDVTAADALLAEQLAALGPADSEEAALAAVAAAEAGAVPSAFTSRSSERQRQQREARQQRLAQRGARAAGSGSEEDEGDESGDELEIVIPEGGGLDPVALSTLPPSLALELVGAERERLQAANRAALQARAAAPADFSQFQLEQYLAATAFRRQVEEVKDALNREAAGGSGARRIAGESGREYVLVREEEEREEREEVPGGAAQQQQPQPQPQEQQLEREQQEQSQQEQQAVLDICFEIDAGGNDSDASAEGDVGWEDVEGLGSGGGSGGGGSGAKRHWRERAAERQKYWSMSHGFQMGRKLATWGEAEAGAGAAAAVEGGGAPTDEEAVDVAADVVTPRKALIARSPPRGSARRDVPEDEDGQLQEAIRRSLADIGSSGGSRSSRGTSASRDTTHGAEPSLAAAADQQLQQLRQLRLQQQQPPVHLPEAAEAIDLVAGAERASVGSGSDADLMWEDAGPAEAGGGSEQQGATGRPGLLASINRQSTQRLEAWLAAGAAAEAASPAAAAPVATEQPDELDERPELGSLTKQQPAVAAAAGTPVLAGEVGDGTEWEDVGPAAASAPAAPAAAAAASQPPLDEPTSSQQARRRQAPADAAEAAGRLAHAAAPRAARPAMAHAAEPPADKRVRFSSAVEVRVVAEAEAPAERARQAAAAPPATPPPAPAPSPGTGPAAAPPAAAPALVGGFTAAELEQLVALEGEEGAWENFVSPPASQQTPPGGPAQQGTAQPAGGEPALSPADVDAQLESLAAEERRLRAAQRAGRGQTETPTADMYQDCMELLTMFGLPYIIAPQEAEAQCAWLDAEGLVEGVVTDDNDVFLFGARRVYRHIFESKRYVEEYRAEDVQRELGLGRAQLAALAQLLGGDYCEGVAGARRPLSAPGGPRARPPARRRRLAAGVGIVNAVEVVHAFPGPDGLARFRDWLAGPDEQLLEMARRGGRGRGRGGRRARGRAGRGGGAAGPASSPEQPPDNEQPPGGEPGGEAQAALVAEFTRRHRGVRRSWEPPPGFPSTAVAAAYASPKVDASKDRFSWGRPDLELLRDFCAERFGWAASQADELLAPVAAAFEQRQSQQTLDSFLTMRQRFAKIKSRRLQKAVAGIAGGARDELMLQEGEDAAPGSAGKRKRSTAGQPGEAAEQAPTATPDAAPKRQRRQPAGGRGRGGRAGRAQRSAASAPAGGSEAASAAVEGTGALAPASQQQPSPAGGAGAGATAQLQPRRGRRAVPTSRGAGPG